MYGKTFYGRHTAQHQLQANKILGLIKLSFVHIDCELFLKLYKSFVRPTVDYCNAIWYPDTKKKNMVPIYKKEKEINWKYSTTIYKKEKEINWKYSTTCNTND